MAKLYGVLAEFRTPEDLIAAINHAHEVGYERLEAFTPFPVEGLAEALGFTNALFQGSALAGGLFGAALAIAMQVYVATDYPLNVGGRALIAIPAFAVVTFELTILFAVFFAIGCMLWRNRLPRLSHPLFDAPRFHLATRDRFFLCIEGRDSRFDTDAVRAALAVLKPLSIAEVPPMRWLPFLLMSVLLAGCGKGEMAVQPKAKAYRSSALFSNQAVNQVPPEGTVARGDMARSTALDERPTMTARLLVRGHERFDIFCAPCHGRDGVGDGLIVQRGFPQPISFHEPRLRDAPDRYFVDVIGHGYGAMFSYAARVPPADRWAITAYIRALQLSQNVPQVGLTPAARAELETAP